MMSDDVRQPATNVSSFEIKMTNLMNIMMMVMLLLLLVLRRMVDGVEMAWRTALPVTWRMALPVAKILQK